MLTLLVIRRVGIGILTLLIVSVIVFSAIHFVPGGYEDVILGPFASPEARARISERYGLDAPLIEQYWLWLKAAVQGDFGTSLVTGEPVANEFARRLPATFQLGVMSALLSLAIGLPLALLAGWPGFRSGIRDSARFTGALQMSLPDFVVGSILVYLFSAYSLGLTVGGFVPFFQDPGQNLQAMLPPALALCVFGSALITRTGRDSVLLVSQEPYITAATAAGRKDDDILRRHVLRNAAVPIVTVIATFIGYVLSGTIIVETLFSVPGIGQYVFQAVGNRDYAVVMAGVLLASAVFIIVNTLADVACALIDPRLRSRPT